MSLFDSLGVGNATTTAPTNPIQMLSQLKGNPAQMLKQAGYNIPANMNNPQEIINHLLNSGQVNNSRLNMAQQMARQFGRR